MRNLKRALSLTLASVMLLGMMVIGTSAASFNDAEDISNVTAATVLQELKVMQGSGGSFAPNETVTRGQMAILICKILYGDKLNISQFSGTTMFNDVPANSYYTGYVNLAAQLGIISGYGNGQFGPGDSVTTAQAALMLTRALGWFQGGELKGQNWGSNALAAVSQATKIYMFGDLNLGINDPLSRDNVAEMIFNTLTKAVPVQYSERWDTYYTDQNSVMSGVKFDYKNTLGYTNYSLVYTEANDKDDFGRPAITWGTGTVTKTDADGKLDTTLSGDARAIVILKDKIVTSAKAADKVYVGEVKAKDIWNDLDLRNGANFSQSGNLTIYTDKDTSDADTGKAIVKNGDATANKFGVDGQTVEIYYTKGATAADDKITMVITSTYLGVVTDVNYKQDNKTGIRIDVLGKGLKFFEADGYEEDDLILVNLSNNEVKAILGTPKTITGEATRVGISSEVNRSLTIDGKKYSQSTLFTSGDNDVIKGETNAELAIEKTYTLYLDQNDCFLAAVMIEDNSQTDLVYVTRVYNGNTLDGDEVIAKPMATVVYMDGTYKTVPLTKGPWASSDVTPSNQASAANTAAAGKLAELVYDEDEKEYELKAVNAGDWKNTDIPSGGSKIELETDSRYAKLDRTNNVYLDTNTVYVFVSYKDGDVTKGIDNVKVVTGGVNFDIETTMTGAYAKKASERTAAYVVIASEYEAASKDILYIKESDKQEVKDGRMYKGYFADSTEKVQIPVDKTTASYTTLAEGYYEYTLKDNGNYKLTAVGSGVGDKVAGAIQNQTITSMMSDSQGYLMQIATDSAVTYDMKNVNVIDMTDASKPSENANGSSVNGSLSALEKVVNSKDGEGNLRYVVKASIYVNKDNEVTNLVINKIENKAGAVTAVYESAVQSDITLDAAANKISIGGVDTTVTGADMTLSDLATAIGNTTLGSTWTVAVDNDDIKLTQTTAGTPVTSLAGATKVTEGAAAKAATATIKVAAANASNATIGSHNAQDITGTNATGSDSTNGYSWTTAADPDNAGDYIVTVTTTATGAAANGTTDGITFAGGADAVAAVYKLENAATAIANATKQSKSITIGAHTATVTKTAVADYLAEFVTDYNANSTEKDNWTATVDVDGSKVVYTAKIAGAIGQSGPASAPTGASVRTEGAEAN